MEACSYYWFSNGWCTSKDANGCLGKDACMLFPEEMLLHRPETQWLQTFQQRICRDGGRRLLKASLHSPLPWSAAALQTAKTPFTLIYFSPLPSYFSASTSLQWHELPMCGQINWPNLFLHRAQTQDPLKTVAGIWSQVWKHCSVLQLNAVCHQSMAWMFPAA